MPLPLLLTSHHMPPALALRWRSSRCPHSPRQGQACRCSQQRRLRKWRRQPASRHSRRHVPGHMPWLPAAAMQAPPAALAHLLSEQCRWWVHGSRQSSKRLTPAAAVPLAVLPPVLLLTYTDSGGCLNGKKRSATVADEDQHNQEQQQSGGLLNTRDKQNERKRDEVLSTITCTAVVRASA